MHSRGQNSLEYLLLIAGAILVGVVVLLLLASGIVPMSGSILTNNLGVYTNQIGGSGYLSNSTPNLCANGASNLVFDPGTSEECDGSDFGIYGSGIVSCSTYNPAYTSGDLSCTPVCTIDVGSCLPVVSGEPVTIYRDTWGVPHVFASTDEGAFYGWGYVAAQDRWYIMDYTRMKMRGRLSELEGSGAYDDDYSMRLLGYAYMEEQRYPQLSTSTRAALDAYAAGVNAYLSNNAGDLAAHPMAAHAYFQGRTPEPWTGVDSLLVWDSVFLQGPDEEEVRQLRALEALPPGSTPAEICNALNFTYFIDNESAVVKQTDMPNAGATFAYAGGHPTYCNGLQYFYPPPKASHAWAVNGARSTTGNTILMGDPQILIETPSLFHEVHVAGASFNARGVNIPGSVGFFVGFTNQLGWSATKLSADTDDVFRLEMVSPNMYRDASGNTHAFLARQETISSSNGSPTNVTFYHTQYGPLITNWMDATLVNPGEEFVWRSTLFYDMTHHTVDGALQLMRGQNVNDFANAMQYWHTPTANFIFGDAGGNIGYWYGARPPMRSSQSPVPGYIAQETDNDWVELIPHDLLPHTINPAGGIVFSANHLPVGDWYPIYLSPYGGGGDTIRSYRLRQLLGLTSTQNPVFPGDPGYISAYSPTDVLNIHHDSVHSVKTMAVKMAIYAEDVLGYSFSPTSQTALSYLRTWYGNGAKSHSDELYWPLAESVSVSPFFKNNAYNIVQLYRPDDSGMVAWFKNVDHNLTTNLGLAPNELQLLDDLLADALTTAHANYGNVPAQWNAAYAIKPGDGRFRFHYYDPISPGNDASAIGGNTYNVTIDNLLYPNLDTIGAMRGQSYSQFIDFSTPDSALALSPITVTDDPNSPYYLAQQSLYENHQLHAAPLSRSAVEALPASVATPTQQIIYKP